ncbi:MAG: DUF1127 domain-containing protein [Pseudomonadota bacterium]
MNGLSDVRLTLHGPADLGRWGLFWHRSRTRRALLNLDEQQLRDVGLSREMAQREGLKPFWCS